MSDDKLLRALGGLAREQGQAAPPPELDAAPAPEAKDRAVERALAALGPPQKPVPTRSWRRWTLAMVPALAAAAALVLLWPGIHAPLPGYELELRGGVAETRAAPAPATRQPLLLDEGSPIDLRLRPAEAVRGGVEVHLFWISGGQTRRWSAPVEVATSGAARVVGKAPRPFGAAEGELVAVVARPGTVRVGDSVDVAALERASQGAQWLRWPVRWR